MKGVRCKVKGVGCLVWGVGYGVKFVGCRLYSLGKTRTRNMEIPTPLLFHFLTRVERGREKEIDRERERRERGERERREEE